MTISKHKINYKFLRFQVETTQGLNSYLDAYYFILKSKLWISVLLIGVLFYILLNISWDYLESFLLNLYSELLTYFSPYLVKTLKINGEYISQSKPIIGSIIGLMKYPLFASIFMIIGSPALVYLSQKTDEIKTGIQYKSNFKQSVWEILRGVKIGIINFFKQNITIFFLMLAGFIPLIGFLNVFFIFLVQAYYNGFTMIDYSLERRKMNVKNSLTFCSHHKGYMVGIGIGFMFLSYIPAIGWFIAPSFSVITATLFLLKNIMPKNTYINDKSK